MDKYRKALCSLVRRYSKSLRSLRNIKSEKLTDDEYQALNVNTLVEILLFDIIKMRSKGRSGMDCYKNMVHRLRWLNYALYNCYALGLLTDDRRINAQILRPYSNIRFPKRISLDDSSFLKRTILNLAKHQLSVNLENTFLDLESILTKRIALPNQTRNDIF